MADSMNGHKTLFSFDFKEFIVELFLYAVCVGNIFINYKAFLGKSEGLT